MDSSCDSIVNSKKTLNDNHDENSNFQLNLKDNNSEINNKRANEGLRPETPKRKKGLDDKNN